MSSVACVENHNFKLCCFAQELNVIVLGSIAELFTEILHFFSYCNYKTLAVFALRSVK